MSLAIPVDQPPEPDDAHAEACHTCGGEGTVEPSRWVVRVCARCKGTGDEPAEPTCAS